MEKPTKRGKPQWGNKIETHGKAQYIDSTTLDQLREV